MLVLARQTDQQVYLTCDPQVLAAALESLPRCPNGDVVLCAMAIVDIRLHSNGRRDVKLGFETGLRDLGIWREEVHQLRQDNAVGVS